MKLKELRKLAGLTQFELAQRCSISRMRLSLIECGQAELRPEEETEVRALLLRLIQARAAEIRGVLSGVECASA